jgi:hypothetical protein
MNILKDKATWKSYTEKPKKSGVYLTFSKKEGFHQWNFNVDYNQWGNGLYTPGDKFKWLNVRIDVESGLNLQC